jgi:hypothetical protein
VSRLGLKEEDMRQVRSAATIASLTLVAVLSGAASAIAGSEISTWKTEEVELGVLRVLDDRAGHDLTERYPTNHRDMDHIAIADDGTVWIAGTASGSDNALVNGFMVWPLGQEGLWGIDDGVPDWIDVFEFTPDGILRTVGAGIDEFDGSTWSGTSGSPHLVTPDGTVWFASTQGGVESWDGEAFEHHLEGRWIQWLGIDDGTLWAFGDGYWTFEYGAWSRQEPAWAAGLGTDTRRRIMTSDGAVWKATGNGVTRRTEDGVTRYLKGRPINEIAVAPDGAVWAIGGVSRTENGGVYRIKPPGESDGA